jgi:hypothetical protein
LNLPLLGSRVDHLACQVVHWRTSVDQADCLCSIDGEAFATGAFAEVGADFGLHDGSERVMASAVLANFGGMAKIEACGFCSSTEKLGVVEAVRPTFVVDEKRMGSRKDFADDLVPAGHG